MFPRAVTRASLWLLGPAPAAVHPAVWRVVCLAALSSMEYGRARLWAVRHDVSRAGGAAVGSLPADVVRSVAHAAAARFWHVLQDFVLSVPVPRRSWTVSDDHPFVCVVSGLFRIRLPASAILDTT